MPSLHFSRQQRKLENVSEADKYKRETAGWENSKPVVIRDGLATIVTSLIYLVYYRASSHRISATVLVRHNRERGTHARTHTYTPLCSQFTFPFLNQYFLCLLLHPSLINGNSALKKKKKRKNADFTLMETYLWRVDCISACGHPRNPVFLPHGRFNVPWTSAEILFSLWFNYHPMNGSGSGTAWCICNAALSLHTLVHKQNKEVIWDITGKKLMRKKKCSMFAHRKWWWLCPSETRQRT